MYYSKTIFSFITEFSTFMIHYTKISVALTIIKQVRQTTIIDNNFTDLWCCTINGVNTLLLKLNQN